jgi:hypothetical protein
MVLRDTEAWKWDTKVFWEAVFISIPAVT